MINLKKIISNIIDFAIIFIICNIICNCFFIFFNNNKIRIIIVTCTCLIIVWNFLNLFFSSTQKKSIGTYIENKKIKNKNKQISILKLILIIAIINIIYQFISFLLVSR